MEQLFQEQNLYQQVLYSLKGSQMCAQQRKDHALCRATSVGRSGDPSFCDTQAAYLLNCYHEMQLAIAYKFRVKYTKENCAQQYALSEQCLQKSDAKSTPQLVAHSISGLEKKQSAICSNYINAFKNC